jgi:hypothetical protein
MVVNSPRVLPLALIGLLRPRLVVAACTVVAACADPPPPAESTARPLDAHEAAGHASDATTPAAPDDRVFPPWDWASLAGPPVLCLTFDGATVSGEESFIVPEGDRVHIPPFDARAAGVDDRGSAIAAILARVRAHFAKTALAIVDVCPEGTPYTRLIVGGHPSLIGEASTVAGIAPYDVGNRMEDDVGFVFPEVITAGRGSADLSAIAATISHEAGHTFGLDHVLPVEDLMHPIVDARMSGFTAAMALDGHWQDAPALLATVLGPSTDRITDEPGATETPDCDPPEDASGRARDAARLVEADGRIQSGWTCATDEDWFAVDLAPAETLALTLVYPTEGWVEPPAIFRPRGRRPVGDGVAGPGEHRWDYRASTGGRHRIRITTSDAAATRYALRLERRR